MEPGSGPPKRARRDDEERAALCPAQEAVHQLESQRMLAKAADLRREAEAVQREAEAAAAAAAARGRRQAAERLLERGRVQAAAAEQRALEGAQPVLQKARASIQAAAAAAAMEPEGSPARMEAAAAAAAALASAQKQVAAHVAAIKARAEIAHGVTKAQAAIAAAAAEEAAAQAALAGWPAEQQQLLDRAARLEQQAVLVAELEAQQGSALVQALATSGCLPLIAGCLGEAADKVHFALSCKALLRQYRQDGAAWLGGLHVSLQCSVSKADVAACGQRLQHLLQQLPPGSMSNLNLAVSSGTAISGQDVLCELLMQPGCQGLVQLELDLSAAVLWFGTVELNLPLLRSIRLTSNGLTNSYSCKWSFGSVPLLESLQLEHGVVLQLPPALTHLDLDKVNVREKAAATLLSGTALCLLRLQDCDVEGAYDVAQLSSLTRLTSLTLAGSHSAFMSALNDSMPTTLAPLRSLGCLALTGARADVLAQLDCSLTQLCLSVQYYSDAGFELSHITRHTDLQSLVWVGGPWEVRRQIKSLTHIRNLSCF